MVAGSSPGGFGSGQLISHDDPKKGTGGEAELFWGVGMKLPRAFPFSCLELGETGAFQGAGAEAFPRGQGLKEKEKEVSVVKQG